MSFWDGTRWVPEAAPTAVAEANVRWRDWAATIAMILVVSRFTMPFASTRASTPTISVSPSSGIGGNVRDRERAQLHGQDAGPADVGRCVGRDALDDDERSGHLQDQDPRAVGRRRPARACGRADIDFREHDVGDDER